MKRILFTCILLLSIASVHGQIFKDGTYLFSSQLHDFKNIRVFDISNQSLHALSFNDDKELQRKSVMSKEKYQFKEYSLINKNSANLTWINSCEECVWTETQILNIFYLGNDFIYKGITNRIVNNNQGIDCFDTGGKCFTTTKSGYIRIFPNLIYKKNSIHVGGKSDQKNEIKEIRITDKTTEITLIINTTSGIINPVGNNQAFYVSLNNGKKLKLLGQYGWKGDSKGGFGTWATKTETKREVILFFEPASAEDLGQGFSLKEGNCTAGCWNFYDISI